MRNPFDPGYYHSEELRGFGFAHVGDNVQIAKNCTIIGLEHISIGNHVRIDGFTSIIAAAPVRFGNYIHIGGHCHLVASAELIFGDFSGTSQGVRIYTATDDYAGEGLAGSTIPRHLRRPTIAPVSFGKYVIVGANTVVLPRGNIGEGSVVGAQSLVTKPLPPWGVYSGSPARFLKPRLREIERLAEELEVELSGQA